MFRVHIFSHLLYLSNNNNNNNFQNKNANKAKIIVLLSCIVLDFKFESSQLFYKNLVFQLALFGISNRDAKESIILPLIIEFSKKRKRKRKEVDFFLERFLYFIFKF